MSNPTVAAVMLVNGRHDMVDRALACFREQSYQNKRLAMLDTGNPWIMPMESTIHSGEWYFPRKRQNESIGVLRNKANGLSESDIIVHLDSDDWSHPRRIEEQVALLQASGKDCVGYRDMLFWRETYEQYGTAYLYSNPQPSYALGTSLCYWRSAWERHPFADLPKHGTGAGEDAEFIRSVDTLGVTSLDSITVSQSGKFLTEGEWLPGGVKLDPTEPRMIASLHGDNTSTITALAIKHGDPMIRRAPEFDAYCRERVAL